ncbi:hypothetical protein ON010_g4748 [Phytophthora cinnamomi]|nr:hypothetical protein ON010_g4748 [Phytophthora cinnamomi]
MRLPSMPLAFGLITIRLCDFTGNTVRQQLVCTGKKRLALLEALSTAVCSAKGGMYYLSAGRNSYFTCRWYCQTPTAREVVIMDLVSQAEPSSGLAPQERGAVSEGIMLASKAASIQIVAPTPGRG